MKGERKLRLVPPPGGGAGGEPPAGGPGDEPPPTEAELAEAAALREAMERGEDPLAAALRAAFDPSSSELDGEDHDALLARALGDVDAAPTKIERERAEILRGELDAENAKARRGAKAEGQSDEAALAGALRAAWAPRPIDPLKNEALIAQAMRKGAPAQKPRGRVISFTMVSLGAMAAVAAGVLLFAGQMGNLEGGASSKTAAAPPAAPMTSAQASFIPARSAADLFDAATPFPRTGGESARIDRIASARAADLRANRFAAWGVR
jgi:hypothetical protein